MKVRHTPMVPVQLDLSILLISFNSYHGSVCVTLIATFHLSPDTYSQKLSVCLGSRSADSSTCS